MRIFNEKIDGYYFDSIGNDWGDYEIYENNGKFITVWYPHDCNEKIYVKTTDERKLFDHGDDDSVVEYMLTYLEK